MADTGFNGNSRMRITRSLIKSILQKNSVVDYLANRGYEPIRQLGGGRLAYLCPMPWHEETKPSFIVWTEAEYENFYCFGCQSKHNILHLIAFLESISVREVIERLSKGIQVTVEDGCKMISNDLREVKEIRHAVDMSRQLLNISSISNTFLRSVDYDEKECELMESLWQVIDDSLRDFEFGNIDRLNQEVESLIDKRAQRKRK